MNKKKYPEFLIEDTFDKALFSNLAFSCRCKSFMQFLGANATSGKLIPTCFYFNCIPIYLSAFFNSEAACSKADLVPGIVLNAFNKPQS